MISGDTVCNYHEIRRVSPRFVIITEFRHSVSKYCTWLNEECDSYTTMTQHTKVDFTAIGTQFYVAKNFIYRNGSDSMVIGTKKNNLCASKFGN